MKNQVRHYTKKEWEKEQYKGRWEYDENAVDFNIGGWRCSECGVRNNNLPNDRLNPYLFSGSSYCPQCGAKMDGKEK